MKKYIVATTKDWNLSAFERRHQELPGSWQLVTTPNALEELLSLGYNPRYIFFPHWSWIVPPEIYNQFECVCFHCSDVPFGRGGSPLQNLIMQGLSATKLTALRMMKEVDAGPVYLQSTQSLEGSAQEIFERLAEAVYDLTLDIVRTEPIPVEQVGEPVIFKRRTPDQSELPASGSLELLYDHVRMLDAKSYPSAFIRHGAFKIEFTEAHTPTSGQMIVKAEIKLDD